MKQIAIVSAKRTPIGKYKGKLRNYSAVELGTTALKELLNQLISIHLLLNKLFSEMSYKVV